MFHVGDVIRKLRGERDWTLEDLSARAKVNKATISQIERGEANPQADTISRIAVALGTTSAELHAATVRPTPTVRGPGEVDDELLDVTGYTKNDIPVIAEGEAAPQGSLFWDDEGRLKSEVEDRITRPYDVRDPAAYGVRVRGDSMMPAYKPGMILVVSPTAPVRDGDEVYVQLVDGERLLKVARKIPGGWMLESINPAYEPRMVKRAEVGAMHPVLWARRRR